MSNIVKRLRVKADIIQLGESIAWGSDSEIMREAADIIERQREALRVARDALEDGRAEMLHIAIDVIDAALKEDGE